MKPLKVTIDVSSDDICDVLAAVEGPQEWPDHEFDELNAHLLRAYYSDERPVEYREGLFQNMPASLQWAVNECEKYGPWRLRAVLLEARIADLENQLAELQAANKGDMP